MLERVRIGLKRPEPIGGLPGLTIGLQLAPRHKRRLHQDKRVERRPLALSLFRQQTQLERLVSRLQFHLTKSHPVGLQELADRRAVEQGHIAPARLPLALAKAPAERSMLPELPRVELVRPVGRHGHAILRERLGLAGRTVPVVGQPVAFGKDLVADVRERVGREPRSLGKVRLGGRLSFPPHITGFGRPRACHGRQARHRRHPYAQSLDHRHVHLRSQ